MVTAIGALCLHVVLALLCLLISWLRLKQHAAHVYRQGPGCAGQACHAKICACVATCNTMWVCKCTELCLWSGGYFLPLIGIATGLGCCLLSLDKDAVCGPLLGACVAAWTEGLTHRWRDEGAVLWGGGGYIYPLVTPVQTSKHGDIPELFYCRFPTMSLHSVTGLRGFLTCTLLFCVVLILKRWHKQL